MRVGISWVDLTLVFNFNVGGLLVILNYEYIVSNVNTYNDPHVALCLCIFSRGIWLDDTDQSMDPL